MTQTHSGIRAATATLFLIFSTFQLASCKENTSVSVDLCWHEARDAAWELLVAKAKAEDTRPFTVVYEEINQARIAAYNACMARAKS